MSSVDHAAKGSQACTPPAVSTATFADIDISTELAARSCRAPDYDRERQALALLAVVLAENPRIMLQRIAEAAVDLCGAHSAGISVLDGDEVRWEAVAGALESSRGDTMPRRLSPCGVSIDRRTTQLLHLPDRCFPAVRAEPRLVEALIVPFQHHWKSAGTVWLASHSADRKFDREDERVMRVLAAFASVGCQLWQANAVVTEATGEASDPSTEGRRPDEVKLALKRVSLWPIVSEAVEATGRRRDRRLMITLGNEPVWLNADSGGLRQVFSTLIDLAISGQDDPPVTVGFSMRDGEVSISIGQSDRGLPEDGHIAAFYPAPGVTGHQGSADDLQHELSAVRRLAELHGGTITMLSRGAGRGSSFRVRLPLAAQRRHERTPTREEGSSFRDSAGH